MKTVQEVLLGAAEAIESVGWCQGGYFDAEGRVCAAGAIHMAINGRPSYFTLDTLSWEWRTAIEARMAVEGVLGRELVTWNDEPGRTREEVIEKLREAAG